MDEDSFSTTLKGITLGYRLRGLYLAPALIFLCIAISQIFDFIIFIFLLLFYYTSITILIIFYFRKRSRKEALEKIDMRDAEDKFYREYFRKKNNQL